MPALALPTTRIRNRRNLLLTAVARSDMARVRWITANKIVVGTRETMKWRKEGETWRLGAVDTALRRPERPWTKLSKRILDGLPHLLSCTRVDCSPIKTSNNSFMTGVETRSRFVVLTPDSAFRIRVVELPRNMIQLLLVDGD